jgi:hypothetical protein
MPKLLIEIASGRVVNRIPDPSSAEWQPPAGQQLAPDDGRPIAPATALPPDVARWAARAALDEAGMLNTIDSAVSQLGTVWRHRLEATRWQLSTLDDLNERLGISQAVADALYARAVQIEREAA